jgi:hypothetical protein
LSITITGWPVKNKTKDAVDYLVQSLKSGHSKVQYLKSNGRFHAYTWPLCMDLRVPKYFPSLITAGRLVQTPPLG